MPAKDPKAYMKNYRKRGRVEKVDRSWGLPRSNYYLEDTPEVLRQADSHLIDRILNHPAVKPRTKG